MPAIVRRRLVGIPILASPRDPAGSSECWGLQEWPFKWVRSPELQRFRHCEGVAGGRGSTTVVAGPIEVTFDEEHLAPFTKRPGKFPAALPIVVMYRFSYASMIATISCVRGLMTTISSPTRM